MVILHSGWARKNKNAILATNKYPSMSKQKAKGSSWERDIAKFLSTAYNESFIRNISGSGAYVGGKNIYRAAKLSEDQLRHTRGDISVPESFAKLNIEAKNYADFSWHLMFGENKQIDGWIDQLMCVATEGDVNLLAIKVTRRGSFVVVQSKLDWDRNCNHMVYSNNHGTWVVYSFEEFFRLNTEKLKQFSTN